MSDKLPGPNFEATYLQLQRVLLHNMATPLTVLKTMLKKLEHELQSSTFDAATVQKRLRKSLSAIEKLEEIHAENKAQLSELEAKAKKAIASRI